MIPDRYQYLVDLHNQRMFAQHRRARRKFIAGVLGLGLLAFPLLSLLVVYLRWFVV